MATILGIDTATAEAAVAVTNDGDPPLERSLGADEAGRLRHSAGLLGEIEAAVDEAGGWEKVDLIAVGIGPGSYTGLRIGIATARALAQGLGKPITGVVSLAALARGIGALSEAPGRPRLAAIDARRGEVFAYLEDAAGEQAWEPFVADPGDLIERLSSLQDKPLAAGDGALRFRQELESAGVLVPPDGDTVHRIAARHICALAERPAPTRPEQIEPLYLRPPDAQVWLERDSR